MKVFPDEQSSLQVVRAPPHLSAPLRMALRARLLQSRAPRGIVRLHTCHILPPSEIDVGLCLAAFAGSGGKYLFHRIGKKGRIWQPWIAHTPTYSRARPASRPLSHPLRAEGPPPAWSA